MTGTPEDRLPVVVAAGQVTEKGEPVDVLELCERASQSALEAVPGLRPKVRRVSLVGTLSPTGPALAGALARRLGLAPATCETTVIGGNTPQALVTRAAADIAAGTLDATLIAGGEVMRSVRAGRSSPPPGTAGPADPVYGVDRMGVGPSESAAGLFLPVHIYAMIESAIAGDLGHHDPGVHRAHLGRILEPFAAVASGHPQAWFPDAPTAEQISCPGPDNRVVAEPYTKRMCAFLQVDQAAALVVCSLAAARAAGVADRAVFIWAGASCNDVWEPVRRPVFGRSPGIEAAARATLAAAGTAVDQVDHLDLYSCFPAAIQPAARGLGLRFDDPRRLTVTGGLAYFGGPGNNYSTHAIATLTDRLRSSAQGTGLVGALGWYNTKHSYGLYGAGPPPAGFRVGDTAAAQERIDATALPVSGGEDAATGTVVAATVTYAGADPAEVPAFIHLDGGGRIAAKLADAQLGEVSGRSLVGRRARLEAGTHRFRLAD